MPIILFPVCNDLGSFETLFSGWQAVVLMATLVVFLVSALAYMLAGAMNHKGVRTWAVNQMYEGIATLMLAIFFIGLVYWICGLDVRMIGSEVTCTPPDCNLFTVSRSYMDEFTGKIVSGFVALFLTNMLVGYVSSWTVQTVTTGVGFSISLSGGFSQLSQQLGMGMSVLGVSMLLSMAQSLLLRITEQLFGYLMLAGLILRSFGATRGFGGSLIAIAIGFFLIYPLSIVLFYGLVLGHIDTTDIASGYNILSSVLLPILGGLVIGATAGSIIGSGGAGMAVVAGGVIGTVIGAIMAFLPQILDLLATVILGAILIPFITFIIVISFVKGLSAAIGEEVDVSNLTRLI